MHENSRKRIAAVVVTCALHTVLLQEAVFDVQIMMRKIILYPTGEACLVFDVNVMKLIRCFEPSLHLLLPRMKVMTKIMV